MQHIRRNSCEHASQSFICYNQPLSVCLSVSQCLFICISKYVPFFYNWFIEQGLTSHQTPVRTAHMSVLLTVNVTQPSTEQFW